MASSIALPARLSRRASGDESSSLLPLWIILGVGVALAVGWFALSSCLGDHAREALADRIRGLFSRNRGGGSASFGGGMGASGGSRSAYGRMRDDEAEAFDINAAEHDLYDDLDAPHQPYDHHSAYPPTPSGNLGTSKYDDLEDDVYDRRP